jgi:hypothetical protein
VIRARLAYAVSVMLIAVGAALVLGNVGLGLIALGVGGVVGSVWLYDVDEPEEPARASTLRGVAGG